MVRVFFVLFVAAMVSGCATLVEVKPRVPLQGQPTIERTYHVHVKYYNQDDIGITQSTDEIDCFVNVGHSGGLNYYQWHDYKVRHSETGPDIRSKMELDNAATGVWTTYAPGDGFEYTVDGSFVDDKTLSFKTPDLSSIPKDMEGFRFYTNLIDFHTWEVYKKIFSEGATATASTLHKRGDTIDLDMASLSIPLMDWPNLTSNFSLEGGHLKAEYLADRPGSEGTLLPILSFSQNQRLKQFVYGMAGPIQFKMPFNGTTRFMGFYVPDAQGRVTSGSFNEYVYAKVNAPMFLTVIVHAKREYSINVSP